MLSVQTEYPTCGVSVGIMDFSDQLYGIQRVWKVDTQEPIRPVYGDFGARCCNNGVALDNMSLSFLLCKLM